MERSTTIKRRFSCQCVWDDRFEPVSWSLPGGGGLLN